MSENKEDSPSDFKDENDLNTIKDQLQNVQASLEECTYEKKLLRENYDDTRENLKSCYKSTLEFEKNLETESTKLNELQIKYNTELKNLENEIITKQEEYEEKALDLGNKIQKLEILLSKSNINLEISKTNGAGSDNVESCENKILKISLKLTELESTRDSLLSEIKTCRSSLQDMSNVESKKLDKLKEELKTQTKNVEDINEELNTKVSSLNNLEKELESTKARLQECNLSRTELKSEVDNLKESLKEHLETKIQNDKLLEKIKNVEEKLEMCENRFKNLSIENSPKEFDLETSSIYESDEGFADEDIHNHLKEPKDVSVHDESEPESESETLEPEYITELKSKLEQLVFEKNDSDTDMKSNESDTDLENSPNVQESESESEPESESELESLPSPEIFQKVNDVDMKSNESDTETSPDAQESEPESEPEIFEKVDDVDMKLESKPNPETIESESEQESIQESPKEDFENEPEEFDYGYELESDMESEPETPKKDLVDIIVKLNESETDTPIVPIQEFKENIYTDLEKIPFCDQDCIKPRHLLKKDLDNIFCYMLLLELGIVQEHNYKKVNVKQNYKEWMEYLKNNIENTNTIEQIILKIKQCVDSYNMYKNTLEENLKKISKSELTKIKKSALKSSLLLKSMYKTKGGKRRLSFYSRKYVLSPLKKPNTAK